MSSFFDVHKLPHPRTRHRLVDKSGLSEGARYRFVCFQASRLSSRPNQELDLSKPPVLCAPRRTREAALQVNSRWLGRSTPVASKLGALEAQ
jgi:hypothetical protein